MYGNKFSEDDLLTLEYQYSWKEKKKQMDTKSLKEIRDQFIEGIKDERFEEIQTSIHLTENFIFNNISSNLKGNSSVSLFFVGFILNSEFNYSNVLLFYVSICLFVRRSKKQSVPNLFLSNLIQYKCS